MTEQEEERAIGIFVSEYTNTRNLKQAIRAVLLDIDTRSQVGIKKIGEVPNRSLLNKHRGFVEEICNSTGARLETVCSANRGSSKVADARGIIVGVFTDLNYTSRAIADGFGIGHSSVHNARSFRTDRPEWERMIQTFRAKLKGD